MAREDPPLGPWRFAPGASILVHLTGWAARLAMLAGLVAAVLALPGPAAAPAGTATTASLERSIAAEVNALRRSHGLAPVEVNVRLTLAAQAHSAAMARHGFFAHPSRDGTEFWQRIQRYYSSARHRRWAVGENLLWTAGSLDAARALRMWLDSPPHRRVLLGSRWREIGISALRAPSAPGVFAGRDVTIVTADFGVRR